MEYIVEMERITKRFPGIVANDDITVRIRPGEVYALLGENGAGKSTLMSMLFGMYEPDEGTIKLRGEEVTLASPSVATAHKIGMVHQHFKLVHNCTVAENIMMGNETLRYTFGSVKPLPEPPAYSDKPFLRFWQKAGYGFRRVWRKFLNALANPDGFLKYVSKVIPYAWLDRKGVEKRVAELSRQYGLEVDPHALISDLNVSTQQRVEILKMLYRDAEILIFDEPSAVLTPQEIDALIQIIQNLKADGKTIILITHKLDEIKRTADRCAVLRLGKLVDVVETQDVTEEQMAALMVGREVSFRVEKAAPRLGEPVLTVENLTVEDKRKVQRVKNVSLTVRAGEILAVAGVSGNGQVELADAIAGLVKAKAGRISVAGTDLAELSIRKRGELLSYIPEDRQSVGLILDFSLRDNLLIRDYYKPRFCKRGLLRFKEFDAYAKDLILRYDVRSGMGAKTTVRSMSGGNQQKAIVAREIERETPLLIFVQPTRGLDVGAIENIHKHIIAERDKGKAVLLISLELDEVMDLADTIAVMYSGEILKTIPAKDATVEQVGSFMMGIREEAV